MKKRAQKAWSMAEICDLMAQDGQMTRPQWANAHGRTLSSVHNKLQELGFKWPGPTGRPRKPRREKPKPVRVRAERRMTEPQALVFAGLCRMTLAGRRWPYVGLGALSTMPTLVGKHGQSPRTCVV